MEIINKGLRKIIYFTIKYTPQPILNLGKKIYNPYKIYPYPFGETDMEESRLNSLLPLLEKQVKSGVEGDIIECGVFRGGTSVKMGLKLKELGSDKKIHAIDTFEGHPFDSTEDIEKDGVKHHYLGRYNNTDIESVKKAALKKGADNVIYYKGDCQFILPKFTDKKICFAHIDVNTYKSTLECTEILQKIIVNKGIIVFDDYNDSIGATKAINELIPKNQLTVYEQGQGAYWRKI